MAVIETVLRPGATPDSHPLIPARQFTILEPENDTVKDRYLEPFSLDGNDYLMADGLYLPVFESDGRKIYRFLHGKERWVVDVEGGLQPISSVPFDYDVFSEFADNLVLMHKPASPKELTDPQKSTHDRVVKFIASNWDLVSAILNPSSDMTYPSFCVREIRLPNGNSEKVVDLGGFSPDGVFNLIEVGPQIYYDEEQGFYKNGDANDYANISPHKDSKVFDYDEAFKEGIGRDSPYPVRLFSAYYRSRDNQIRIYIQEPTVRERIKPYPLLEQQTLPLPEETEALVA